MVAGEDDRAALAEILHALDDEQHALLAGLGGDVVGVRVGEAEAAPCLAVAQNQVGADARTRRAPALQPGNVGRLREPERAGLKLLEAGRAVADRRSLAALAVGVAVLAHERVAGQVLAQVRRLVGADLLKAEYVKVEAAQQRNEVGLALLPCVRRAGVGDMRYAAGETYVVRADANRRLVRRRRHAAACERNRGRGKRDERHSGQAHGCSVHRFSSPCRDTGFSPMRSQASAVATRPLGVLSR